MQVYEGNQPYIFVSYAHKDRAEVLPILEAMKARGFRIWYDDGTEASYLFAQTIEAKLRDAACVLAFASRVSLNSRSCADEIGMAIAAHKQILLAFLEPIQTEGEILYSNYIRVRPYGAYESAEAFAFALAEEPLFAACCDTL